MKKALKIILVVLSCLFIVFLGAIIYFSSITSSYKLDESKLVNMQRTVSYLDSKGYILREEYDGQEVTEYNNIPEHVKNAFIAIEDKRFYEHKGVDVKGLFRAGVNNVKSLSLREGASTITQQLIKNTHLSGEKTFKRKFAELKLAIELERRFTKEEILEKYLNTIYFGDGCYGITSASKHYFGKSPEDLTINDGAILAATIKAPSNYSPLSNVDKCTARKNLVLSEMFKQGYITAEEYEFNKNCKVSVVSDGEKTIYDYFYLARKEVNELTKNSPYVYKNIKIYTCFDEQGQKLLDENLGDIDLNTDKSAVFISSKGEIRAYYSSCGDISRQMGSTIKPILVYAPAIENDVVNSCTPILDEKTDFNGYCPSNYNDKYYGYVSVKESLSKSLNVCSAKLLNYVGVENAFDYLKKTDIPFCEEDLNLSSALGATINGAKLTQLTSSYSLFINDGNYLSPHCVLKITTEDGDVIYERKEKAEKIFGEDTVCILNDMMSSVVTDGTAKKLSFLDFPVCAKTGTVGTDIGNTDAYSISYTTDAVLGVWFGNKDNSIMDNKITGGGIPTVAASEFWKRYYSSGKYPSNFNVCDSVSEIELDAISYKENHRLELADEKAPKRYKMKALFKNSSIPTAVSTRFSSPEIKLPEIIVNNGKIQIRLCQTEYFELLIYRAYDNQKSLIYDSHENGFKELLDDDLKVNTEYTYSVIPYCILDGEKIFGEEVIIKKIKSPAISASDWWKNEFD